MKKIISIFTLALFLFTLPTSVAKGYNISKEKKDQVIEQIKQKKKIIKVKEYNIRKLELELDKKGQEFGNVVQILVNRNINPSDEMVNKLQGKLMEFLKIAQQIDKVEKNIELKKSEANNNFSSQNYSQALVDNDKVISLLDEEKALLDAFSISLQELIDLVKSLENK